MVPCFLIHIVLYKIAPPIFSSSLSSVTFSLSLSLSPTTQIWIYSTLLSNTLILWIASTPVMGPLTGILLHLSYNALLSGPLWSMDFFLQICEIITRMELVWVWLWWLWILGMIFPGKVLIILKYAFVFPYHLCLHINLWCLKEMLTFSPTISINKNCLSLLMARGMIICILIKKY